MKSLHFRVVFWSRVTALCGVLIFAFHGRPPARAQNSFGAYAVPDVTHDGLVGALTHQNDLSNKLADDVSSIKDQQKIVFVRLNALESGQTANTTEIRIWGGVLSVLLGSGLLLQVRGAAGKRDIAKKINSVITGGGA